jgi:hypothetical protein
MFTTAALTLSTTSAKFTRGDAGVRAAEIVAEPDESDGRFAGACAPTAGRMNPPATIAPTRKATTAVSTTVTRVNLRDISFRTSL